MLLKISPIGGKRGWGGTLGEHSALNINLNIVNTVVSNVDLCKWTKYKINLNLG